jgi:hypothetical protein
MAADRGRLPPQPRHPERHHSSGFHRPKSPKVRLRGPPPGYACRPHPGPCNSSVMTPGTANLREFQRSRVHVGRDQRPRTSTPRTSLAAVFTTPPCRDIRAPAVHTAGSARAGKVRTWIPACRSQGKPVLQTVEARRGRNGADPSVSSGSMAAMACPSHGQNQNGLVLPDPDRVTGLGMPILSCSRCKRGSLCTGTRQWIAEIPVTAGSSSRAPCARGLRRKSKRSVEHRGIVLLQGQIQFHAKRVKRRPSKTSRCVPTLKCL